MAMAKWDKDIHRIHEIQQLLEQRQQYFRGHVDNKGITSGTNPTSFLKPRSDRNLVSSEASFRHSREANFGSIDTTSNDSPSIPAALLMKPHKITDSGTVSDSTDGNRADQSQDESTDDDSGAESQIKSKKKVKKTAKSLSKWATKNVDVALKSPTLSLSVQRNSNASTVTGSTDLRKSSIRFKSISLDNDSGEVDPNTANNNLIDDVFEPESPSPPLRQKKKKIVNPVKMLKRRSWVFKAEMASRLNEDTSATTVTNVVTGFKKSSISLAREKLKKAEKSLRATEKKCDQKKPIYKKQVKRVGNDVTANLSDPGAVMPKDFAAMPVISLSKPGPSRLALRQKQEALKCDLNLREAFAMIKIDPDPLLALAAPEHDSNKNSSQGSKPFLIQNVAKKTSKLVERDSQSSGVDEFKTATSLQRLTKLSVQHLQKQHSLVPNTVQSFQSQKAKKEMDQRHKNMMDKNTKSPENSRFMSFESNRRKSSTSTNNSQHNKPHVTFNLQPQNRRFSKIISGGTRITQTKEDIMASSEHNSMYTLDKLAGTII